MSRRAPSRARNRLGVAWRYQVSGINEYFKIHPHAQHRLRRCKRRRRSSLGTLPRAPTELALHVVQRGVGTRMSGVGLPRRDHSACRLSCIRLCLAPDTQQSSAAIGSSGLFFGCAAKLGFRDGGSLEAEADDGRPPMDRAGDRELPNANGPASDRAIVTRAFARYRKATAYYRRVGKSVALLGRSGWISDRQLWGLWRA